MKYFFTASRGTEKFIIDEIKNEIECKNVSFI